MNVNTLKRDVDRTLEWSLAVLLASMVLVVLWQVAARFVLQDPSSVTEELVRFGLLWVGLLGASYGFGQKSHLAIELLPKRRALELFVLAAVALFAILVLVVGGLRLVDETLALGQTSAALQIPRGYVYIALPLSGVLILFYAIEASLRR